MNLKKERIHLIILYRPGIR